MQKNKVIIEKVYVVKYALTKGIQIFKNVEQCVNTNLDMIVDSKYCQYFHKGDWYINPEEAIKKAEDMRTKKINALKKKIAKLEKLEFNNTSIVNL